MKKNIVVVVMGQDCKDFAEICLESVKDAGAIVFCDGGSKESFRNWILEQGFLPATAENKRESNRVLIEQEFKQDDPEMNGKQRNFYLDFLKKHYAGWWCLVLDADEFVEDFTILRDALDAEPEVTGEFLLNVRMRHLVYNFVYEDGTREKHYAPARLFFIGGVLSYPLGEHRPLEGRTSIDWERDGMNSRVPVIWHLAYAPLFHVRSRYRKNLLHSAVHSKEFLHDWYYAHLFGAYPTKRLDAKDLPSVLLRAFDIDPDEIYFSQRGIEVKHFVDAIHWKSYFFCQTAFEWGCGLGPRIFAMNAVGISADGVDLSRWAVDHSMIPEKICCNDITGQDCVPGKYDLVVAYDLLEHIPYDRLDIAIRNLVATSKKFILLSVPFLGDPNLENDKTHIIREGREWWVKQFIEKGCKQLLVPEHFLFREQLLIFEVV